MKKTVLLLSLLLLCLLAACSSKAAPTTAPDASAPIAAETPEPMMQLETDRGSISYPARWEDDLIVERSEQDGGETLTLSAEVNGTTYELFKVSVGAGPGEQQGTVTAPDGTEQPVFIDIRPLPDLSGLSREDQDLLYGMQEGVNDVIAALNH